MNKLIKALWFATLIATSAFLLFVYAGFTEEQLILITNSSTGIDRETFFFGTLGWIMISNFTFYVLQWRLRKNDSNFSEFTKGWLMGLAAGFNFFLIVCLSFVQVFNGGENFNFDSIGYLIFISLGLIVLWTLALPIYLVKEKISA